jgi:hypothetical protein
MIDTVMLDQHMAAWRRKVLDQFPQLKAEASRPGFSVYSAFFELLPMVREAHLDGDTELLKRIYGFAEWCMRQPNKELWNPAGVAFYEHLFDSHPSIWHEIVCWLSPEVIKNCDSLWEWRLTQADSMKVRELIANRRQPLYQQLEYSL